MFSTEAKSYFERTEGKFLPMSEDMSGDAGYKRATEIASLTPIIVNEAIPAYDPAAPLRVLDDNVQRFNVTVETGTCKEASEEAQKPAMKATSLELKDTNAGQIVARATLFTDPRNAGAYCAHDVALQMSKTRIRASGAGNTWQENMMARFVGIALGQHDSAKEAKGEAGPDGSLAAFSHGIVSTVNNSGYNLPAGTLVGCSLQPLMVMKPGVDKDHPTFIVAQKVKADHASAPRGRWFPISPGDSVAEMMHATTKAGKRHFLQGRDAKGDLHPQSYFKLSESFGDSEFEKDCLNFCHPRLSGSSAANSPYARNRAVILAVRLSGTFANRGADVVSRARDTDLLIKAYMLGHFQSHSLMHLDNKPNGTHLINARDVMRDGEAFMIRLNAATPEVQAEALVLAEARYECFVATGVEDMFAMQSNGVTGVTSDDAADTTTMNVLVK